MSPVRQQTPPAGLMEEITLMAPVTTHGLAGGAMLARREIKPCLARLVRNELGYLLNPGDTDKQQALLASIQRLNQASELLGESLSWLVGPRCSGTTGESVRAGAA